MHLTAIFVGRQSIAVVRIRELHLGPRDTAGYIIYTKPFPLAGAFADNRETLMRDLSARMRSRGPDGSGYYGNEKFGLAHERLAIMDPEGGKQPIVYEDAKYSVCANGEIYNFRQLQVAQKCKLFNINSLLKNYRSLSYLASGLWSVNDGKI